MPSASVSGLPITWFFATVVLTLPLATIPPATLPMRRFPTTVALRAPLNSITVAVLSQPRIVKPETLTSLTRCPVSLPVLMFTSPRTQIASGPKVFEQGESALAGGLITASSPRSLIPSLLIATSSWCTPRTTIVSPVWAAFMAFWMDSPGPTTELCAATEPTPTASATPLATNKVRAMVANNNMVRLIKRPPLCSRGAKEERCQTPAPLRNEGSIPLSEGDVCAPWHKTRQSTKEAPNFRESPKGEVRRINLPRSTVHTVGSNRPRYRREEACPRETSACSQTYDAENTTTPLKRRYGKGYIT